MISQIFGENLGKPKNLCQNIITPYSIRARHQGPPHTTYLSIGLTRPFCLLPSFIIYFQHKFLLNTFPLVIDGQRLNRILSFGNYNKILHLLVPPTQSYSLCYRLYFFFDEDSLDFNFYISRTIKY